MSIFLKSYQGGSVCGIASIFLGGQHLYPFCCKDYTDKPLADLNLDYHKIKKTDTQTE
jgi:hypothetical protein